MKILLSPAKALDFTRSINTVEGSAPVYLNEASELITKLKKLSSKKIAEMMHLSSELSDLNYNRFQMWSSDVELGEDKNHAIAVFNGEAYRGLDVESFNASDIAFAQANLRILSGVYGILKPLDVISPYRLEMGTKWAITPKKKNLYQYWGTKLAENLNQDDEDGVIVNVASSEYFKAIDQKVLKAKVITPIFKEFKNGDYKVIMVFAKRARGSMAKYIIKNKISKVEDIKNFDIDGYRFDENQSNDKEWVFTR